MIFFRVLLIQCVVGLLLDAGPSEHANAQTPDLETLHVEGWSTLRGPEFNGESTESGLIEAFPEEGPPVFWTRKLGQGYSGFTAKDYRLYTQYQSLLGQYVVCLNATTGNTVWEYRYAGPYDPAGLYPGPRATPTLVNDRVYFSSPDGLIGCLDALSGNPIWSWNVFERFGVESVEFGYSCSPTVVGDRMFMPVGQPNATMVAISAKDGKVIWQAGNDPISHVPAFPITWKDRQLLIGYLRNALVAFDADDGRVLWRKEMSHGYDEHAAWPIWSEPYLWISGPFRQGSELIKLTIDEPGYRTVWRSEIMSNDVCSSVLINGSLYGFDLKDVQAKPHRPSRGQFRCVDFQTGAVRWTNGSPAPRRLEMEAERAVTKSGEPPEPLPIGHASVISADGKLILLNDVGELILARANPEAYEELGRARVLDGEIGWTQPTLFRGLVIARSHEQVICLQLAVNSEFSHVNDMSLSDVVIGDYKDWSAIVMPFEPEYAMDVPSLSDFARWYYVILLEMSAAVVLAAVFGGMSNWLAMEENAQKKRTRIWRIWVGLMFLFGLLGTTFLSQWVGMFLFTWPLCLFVSFQVLVYQTGPRAWGIGMRQRIAAGLPAWLALAAFLATCVAYFLICRRLSLVFEWGFLGGFPAAVLPLLAAKWQSKPGWFSVVGEQLLTWVAWTSFYWGAVLGVFWKYQQ